jgi:ribosome-binding protein aMBF1 (putative translation factor)
MNKFGDLIRTKREEQEMLLRHLSAQLDMDTAMLSKIERGEKTAKKESVQELSKIFSLDLNELMSYWLADQLHSMLIKENKKQSLEALEIVKESIK